MKKFAFLLIICVTSLFLVNTSYASPLPAGFGGPNVEDYLDNYGFNYTQIKPTLFTGSWNYTAIAYEAANINNIEQNGSTTFTTNNVSNFGKWDLVNFNTDELFFKDTTDNDPKISINSQNPIAFKFFLINESTSLGYLNNLTIEKGSIIVGWNDNLLNEGDADYDDLITAFTASPIPEPATMILFGISLLGLAGISRKKS